MENNYKYARYSEILNRVTSRLKGFDKVVGEAEILEWCMQVETEFCPNVDNMFIYTGVPLKVVNGRTKPPCNLYRVSDIYTHHSDHGHRIPFNDIGSYFIFDPHNHPKEVFIDYWGTPIDMETGEPLIQRGHEDACEWYCVYNAFFSDAGTGKITSDFWHNTIVLNKEHEILAAQSSSVRFKTKDQLNQEMKITFDELPAPARLWLLRDEMKHHIRTTLP